MFGWRSKFLFMLIVYFAGFATAIYTLAPATDRPDRAGYAAASPRSGQGVQASYQGQQVVAVTKAGLSKFLRLAEEKTVQVGRLIQAKLAAHQRGAEK